MPERRVFWCVWVGAGWNVIFDDHTTLTNHPSIGSAVSAAMRYAEIPEADWEPEELSQECYKYTSEGKFARHLREASETVRAWPKWKQGMLNGRQENH